MTTLSEQVAELERALDDVGEVRDDLHAYIDHIWRVVTGIEEDMGGTSSRDKYLTVIRILTGEDDD